MCQNSMTLTCLFALFRIGRTIIRDVAFELNLGGHLYRADRQGILFSIKESLSRFLVWRASDIGNLFK